MDHNNVNFDFEPIQDHSNVPPRQEQPTYTSQPAYGDGMYTPYGQTTAPQKPKKDRSSVKIVLLIVAIALVGSILGAVLTVAISALRDDTRQDAIMENAQEFFDDKFSDQLQPDEETDYELSESKLPEQLNSYDSGKSLSLVEVYELTVNSVVGIQTEATMNAFGQEAVSASAGSGFILTEDGFIITNCHVVQGADKITVDMYDGTSYSAQLVGSDSSFDIAVLKIDAQDLPAVGVGDSDELKVGEEVVAIGNPLGELTFTMTNGILSALDREINTDGNPQNMLQTNAAINSGNSGGPLFDMDGNVIGVTTAKYSGSTSTGTTIEGLGFAIPINDALKVAYDLVEYGYVKNQAYLGITVKTIDAQTAEYYSLPVGPRVEVVNPGSCAEKADIRVGDIVLAVDDVPVSSNPELLAEMKRRSAGETITLTIFRAGAQMQIDVTLDEKPSQDVIDDTIAEYEQQEQEEQQQQQQPPQDDYYDFEYNFEYDFPFGFDFFG